MFKYLFRYATQRFKQTGKKQVKSGDLTLRKIDDCLFAIYNPLALERAICIRLFNPSEIAFVIPEIIEFIIPSK